MKATSLHTSLRRLGAGVLLTFLAACGGDGGGELGAVPPVRGGSAVLAAPSDLDVANSLVSAERYTQEIMRSVLALPLLRYGPGLSYEPALARSWELLGDTGVVFHLRDDVAWHDGVPTRARDVAFTYGRAMDPATGYPNADYLAAWNAPEVVDSLTVRFTWSRHAEPLAGVPFLAVMPAHLLESVAPGAMRQAAFNQAPVGNGPFRFVERRAGDRWVFEANEAFPEELGGRPLLDRLVWRVVPEAAAQEVELRTGGAHMILSPRADDLARLDAMPDVRAIVRPGRQYGFVGWNNRRPPLDDATVRRALTLALDRERMIQGLRGGYGEAAVGPIGPFHWSVDQGLQPLPRDPAAARASLDAAGLRDTDGDGVRERADGSPFQVELLISANSAINRDLAELIRADLDSVGVRVVPRQVETASLIGSVTAPARDFDAFLLAWEADFRVNLRDLFHGGARDGPYQFAGYANAVVDSLIDAAAAAPTREDALPAYRRIQAILRDEQPWSFLYYYPDLVAAREELRGVEMDIRGIFLTVGDWWLAGGAAAPADSAGGA